MATVTAAAVPDLALELSWRGMGIQKTTPWGAESQTEYVDIPPKTKKRDREALTDHQQEVLHRQRQGDCLQDQSCLVPIPCLRSMLCSVSMS